MRLAPIVFNNINISALKSLKEFSAAAKAVAKEALLDRAPICIEGADFPNAVYKKLAEKYLLNNDEFVRAATELAQKTGTKVALVPSKTNPALQLRIFDGKKLFDMYAKDKNGGLIFEHISSRVPETDNKFAVSDFIKKVYAFMKK